MVVIGMSKMKRHDLYSKCFCEETDKQARDECKNNMHFSTVMEMKSVQ